MIRASSGRVRRDALLLAALLALLLLPSALAMERRPGRRPKPNVDRFAATVQKYTAQFIEPNAVRVLKEENLDLTKWDFKLLATSGQAFIQRGPFKGRVAGMGVRKQPVVVLKDAKFHHDEDMKKEDDASFEALKYEIEVMKEVNGLPFMVRYLGSKVAPLDIKIFLSNAQAGSIENMMKISVKDEEEFAPFSLDDVNVRKLMAEMLMAVGILHNKGFLHRDIKMEQFLIGNDGHVRLTDFGLAIRNDPKVIFTDMMKSTSSIFLRKPTGFKRDEMLLEGAGIHMMLQNLQYRAPELHEAGQISTIQSDIVTAIYEKKVEALKAKKRAASAAATGKQKERLGDPERLTNPEIDKLLEETKLEAAPVLKKLQDQFLNRLGESFVYGKGVDVYALAMTFYEMASGYACASKLKGPYPLSDRAGRSYIPDFDKELDFSYLRSVLQIMGTSDQVENDFVDLLSKMLAKSQRDRVTGVQTLLAHRFFSSAGITFDTVIKAGIASAKYDNTELPSSLTTTAQPVQRRNGFPAPPLLDLLNQLDDLLKDTTLWAVDQISLDGDADGPLVEIEREAEKGTMVPRTRTWSQRMPQEAIRIRDSKVMEALNAVGEGGEGGDEGYEGEGDEGGEGGEQDDGWTVDAQEGDNEPVDTPPVEAEKNRNRANAKGSGGTGGGRNGGGTGRNGRNGDQ
ncbi:hypothetical protein DFJ74DRAFT_759520 [Hyaloraphidium curvatum]|nr:hypothetical protein DFJ74DRAFT_759520 [Hyaloraphidium curvatum]